MKQLSLVKYQAKAKRSNPQRASVGSTEAKPSGIQIVDVESSRVSRSSACIQYDYDGDAAALVHNHVEWADAPTTLIMQNPSTNRIIALPASKRGNDVYRKRVERRVWKATKELREFCKYHNIRVGHASTQVAWVGLTYRNNHEGKWGTISADFNRWTAILRSRYGGKVKPKVKVFRCYESHQSGFVHVHAIVIFFNCSFQTKLHVSRKGGKVTQRFIKYQELKSTWIHGFSDWQAVYDMKGALNYLMKYLTKQLSRTTDSDMLITAKLWYHGLRTFSLSRLVLAMHNSNTGELCLEEMSVTESQKVTWVLLGMVTCSMVDLTKVTILSVNRFNPVEEHDMSFSRREGHIESITYTYDGTVQELLF